MPLSRRTLLAGTAATAAAVALSPLARGARTRPNVLFICIDDLNDWVGVLGGNPQVRTPNIDRLAAHGQTFTNAHCPAPACNPSRTAILTGLRPSTTGVYDNHQPFRKALPTVVTLPQHFRAAGYRVLGSGKIFHAGDPASWDDYEPKSGCGRPPDADRAFPSDRPANGIPDMGSFDWGPGRAEAEGKYSDDRVADYVIKQIRHAKPDEPFFLACGFFRPHLPWYVPQQYFDQYPLADIVLPEVLPNDLDDVPEAGRRLAHIEDHQRIVAAGKWKSAVQAYLASLSFSDAMLGRVLDALADSAVAQDTIIVLWSDHGWSLGEKEHWKKFALWEECTRVPLVLKVPGLTGKGATCGRAVNLVDLFPTLVELCGLAPRDELEGQSLVPLLQDPTAARAEPSLTTHLHGNHALRDERWRYIRYADGSEELYDHRVDPNEWHNLALDEGTLAVRQDLARWLPETDAPEAPGGEHPCKLEGD